MGPDYFRKPGTLPKGPELFRKARNVSEGSETFPKGPERFRKVPERSGRAERSGSNWTLLERSGRFWNVLALLESTYIKKKNSYYNLL